MTHVTRIFPAKFSAGLTFTRPATLTAFPADVWTLSALLRGPTSIDFQATPNGKAHLFSVSAMETSDWPAGLYVYSVRASDGVDVIEVESGEITIGANLAELSDGHDSRDHVRRVLEAIEAVLEKRATIDQERYQINNRELWRTPIGDLLTLRDRYRSELRRLNAAKKGGLFNQSVRVRFT